MENFAAAFVPESKACDFDYLVEEVRGVSSKSWPPVTNPGAVSGLTPLGFATTQGCLKPTMEIPMSALIPSASLPAKSARNGTLSPGVWLAALAALGLSILAGCGQAPTAGSSDVADAPAALGGTWAKQMVFYSESSALRITTRTKVERLLLVRATSDGDRLVTTEEHCEVNSVSSAAAKVDFPEALKRALPTRYQTFTLSDEAGQLRLSAPTSVEVLGARLADAAGDTLPQSPSDPRVFDLDGDGQPGVTVQVKGRVVLVNIDARVYLTQRTLIQESGTLRDAQTIAGPLHWSMEQYTMGSDNGLLARLTPTITPRLDGSVFTMRKLSDDATCATVKARYASLFTPPSL